MITETTSVWLKDEAPAMGSGLRPVTVERGHKECQVRGCEGAISGSRRRS